MPHGSAHVGGVEIVALCDGVLESSSPLEESFLGAPPGTWDDVRTRYPDTVAASGPWRLHVHCFALRSPGRTILVDTVIVTHVHDDHIGWTAFDGGRTLHFPNARYVIHRADWEWMAASEDPEDVEIFAELMKPIADLGALQLSEDWLEVTDELTVLHAPGHTPGHQVVLVDSSGARAVISGDTTNHPVQVTLPMIASATDADPELAVRTRTDLLDRTEREDRLLITAHFPEPFGRITTEDGVRAFHPA